MPAPKRDEEEERKKKAAPDMKLESPQDDPVTGLRYDVRYGDDVVDPKTGLRFDKKYEPEPQDQGPPSVQQAYAKLTPEQKARLDKQLEVADGIKLYRSAGGIGVNANYAPHSRALEARGGLTPEEATELARYRMFKQGAQDIPTGPRAPAQSEEEIAKRREAFMAAKAEERQRMMDEDKKAIARSSEAYFDSLVKPKPAPDEVARGKKNPNTDDEALKSAKALLGKGRINAPEKKVSGNKKTDALLASMGRVKG